MAAICGHKAGTTLYELHLSAKILVLIIWVKGLVVRYDDVLLS